VTSTQYNSTETTNSNLPPDHCSDHLFDDNTIQRHLSLFDLVSIGIGGTIGSGIFVLCGLIAHDYAGPSSILSWTLSGLASCLSGFAYAELSSRIPAAGSSYVYVYASMGELPAVVAAACLTLEYVVSGSAVARSWGDKIALWMESANMIGAVVHDDDEVFGVGTSTTWLDKFVRPGFWNFNPLALVVSSASVLILLYGVKESKAVTNFFTVTKVILVTFMIIVGLVLLKPRENLIPFVPPQFGLSGILRGCTSSFFGYIGFDEICCLAGEAKNPRTNVPNAILLTLACVTFLYILATLSLVGTQSYEEISVVSGFPMAFQSRGVDWAASLSAFGEIFTMPIVVLLSILAQPRLQYALAKDGLLPTIFSRTDSTGNLWHGTLIAGIFMGLIAAFVPFTHLDDVISAGILIVFNMTDSALLLLRYDPPPRDNDRDGRTLEWLVIIVNIASFLFSFFASHFWCAFPGSRALTISSALGALLATVQIYRTCPLATCFGGKRRMSSSFNTDEDNQYFKTPLMPFVPCLGIFVNSCLVGRLELFSIGLLVAYLCAATVFYFCYGFWYSVGNNGGWQSNEYCGKKDCDVFLQVERTISLPRLGSKSTRVGENPGTTYIA